MTATFGTARYLLKSFLFLPLLSVLSVGQTFQQQIYRSNGISPTLQIAVTYPSETKAALAISAIDSTGTLQEVRVEFSDINRAFVDSTALADDGMNGDQAAADGRFGRTIEITRQQGPLRVALVTRAVNGHYIQTPDVIPFVSFVGPVGTGMILYSDEINSDGIANAGEEIWFSLRVQNGSLFYINQLSARFDGQAISLGWIPPQSTVEPDLFPNRLVPYQFFRATMPWVGHDTTITLHVDLWDADSNRWHMDHEVSVVHLPRTDGRIPSYKSSGRHPGSFVVRVVDSLSLLPHEYEIEGHAAITGGVPGFTLRDLTTSTTLLDRVPLPDSSGHGVPVVHGFKIQRGSINALMGLETWSSSGGAPVSWVPESTLSFEYSTFHGMVGWESPGHHFGSLTSRPVPGGDLSTVLIRFASTYGALPGDFSRTNDDTASYAYRYLRGSASSPAQTSFAPWMINGGGGYAYQDYRISVPLSAYDVDTNPPHRLAVGFLENNVPLGSVDGYYWPPRSDGPVDNIASNGPREWLFIFRDHYSGPTALAQWQVNAIADYIPIMYFCTWTRSTDLWNGGSTFSIIPHRMLGDDDVWRFRTSDFVARADDPVVPLGSLLLESYPNPFNASTTIRFTLPNAADVRVRIFDLLGRCVSIILEDRLQEGVHQKVWNADRHSSGSYVCRVEARDQSGNIRTASQKLLLLK